MMFAPSAAASRTGSFGTVAIDISQHGQQKMLLSTVEWGRVAVNLIDVIHCPVEREVGR
jgi:hypothetical protein